MCGHTHPGFSSPLHDAAGTVMFVVTLSILPREGEDVTHAALDAADADSKTGEVRPIPARNHRKADESA